MDTGQNRSRVDKLLRAYHICDSWDGMTVKAVKIFTSGKGEIPLWKQWKRLRISEFARLL